MTPSPPPGGDRRPRRARSTITLIPLAIAILAGTWVYASYHRDVRAASARLESIPTRVCRSQVGDVEYLLAGDGPTVLVSHGVTGGIDQGMPFSGTFGFFGSGYRFPYV
jgi:hypothetical protein